jgi:hypothetical protein
MSTRQDIRVGIAKYFGGTTFDAAYQIYRPTPLASFGLAGVRTYVPDVVKAEDRLIGLTAGTTMGAAMGVWLGTSTEIRHAIGGLGGGILNRPYDVHLMVWHASVGPLTETTQAHVDDLLEAIVARLRADPTLGMGPGSPTVITQAGEGPAGITVSPGWPYGEPGASPRVLQDASIAFQINTYPAG